MTRKTGAVFVFLAAALYSIGGLCIKVIPWNGMSINGGRAAIALVVVGGYLLATRHPLRFDRWVALGTLSVFGTNVFYSMANKLTTAANAIVLQFTAPIFVVIFSILFFRKKPTKLDLGACIVVFSGILLCFLEGLGGGMLLGDVLALLSGVSYAGVFFMEQAEGGDGISSVFFGSVLSAITGLPFLLHETQFTPVALVSLTILGAFQVGLAYILLCIGIKTTPPVTASLISGIEPVLNPLLVALFYGEMMGPLALAGAAIVIGGVVCYNILKLKENRSSVP